MTRGVRLAAAAFAAAFCSMAAAQQVYPAQPIRLIVPYPAGGNPDVVARATAREMEKGLGQPIVIDNRAGASGVIGIDTAARATPNGYTMLWVTSSFAINDALREKPSYSVERDFAPVSLVCEGQGHLLVIHPSVKARTLNEFIELARDPRERVLFASTGTGNLSRLVGELMNVRAGTRMVNVPYKGSTPMLTAVLSGEVQATFTTAVIGLAPIKAGKLRALGFSGNARLKSLPDVPTIAEIVPGFQIDGGGMGWLAPAKTPAQVIKRVQSEIVRALQDPKLRELMTAGGYEPVASTPEEYRKLLRADVVRYREIGKVAGIRLD